MKDIQDRIAKRQRELGRKLTPQELIEVINAPDPDDERELTYDIDEDGD